MDVYTVGIVTRIPNYSLGIINDYFYIRAFLNDENGSILKNQHFTSVSIGYFSVIK